MLKKDRIYTDQQKAFLEAMRDTDNGGDVKRCMKIAGYNSNSPSFLVTSLKDELIEIAKEIMAAGSIKATIGLFSVLDDPAMLGAANRINAAKQILDRANVVTQEQNVKIGVGNGIVIMPAKGSERGLDEVPNKGSQDRVDESEDRVGE